jgi:hypothetical protein
MFSETSRLIGFAQWAVRQCELYTELTRNKLIIRAVGFQVIFLVAVALVSIVGSPNLWLAMIFTVFFFSWRSFSACAVKENPEWAIEDRPVWRLTSIVVLAHYIGYLYTADVDLFVVLAYLPPAILHVAIEHLICVHSLQPHERVSRLGVEEMKQN